LFAACIRSGAAHAFPAIADARVARDVVVSVAREDGRAVAPAAVEALVERLGTDIGQLMGEIEKLSLHVGGRRIEVDDVRDLVGHARARAVEELTDRIARRDLAGAVGVLRGLLDAGEPALRITAFLAANVRRALHVADLADAGLGREEIAQRLRIPGWLVAKSLGRGRAADLIRTQRALRQVDLDLKRSRPAEATLERMLLEISRPTGA
jgi:DNA polymerase III delta subunit